MFRTPILAFTVLASLSPLLTFLRLFQIKEWRLDRLGEHLRREGYASQLLGGYRPFLLLLSVFGLFLYRPEYVSLYVTSILTVLSVLQIALRRQPMPVWTSKALLTGVLSIAITSAAAFLSTDLPLVPVLVAIFQPAIVLVAWAILLPLDRTLKARVFERARHVRARMPNGAVVIGIAGSVGKTTTKELLRHLLQDLSPLSTPQHVNTEMGVAQWLVHNEKNVKPGIPLIIEMGAYAQGEIALLCSVVQPTVGIVTALGSDHLALFGSEEAIIDANGELIEALPVNGHAFLNGDNEATRGLEGRAKCPTALVGTHEGMHAVAVDVEEKTDGLHFRLDNEAYAVPLHGRHHITNVLLAVSVAKFLGVAHGRIRDLLQSFHPLSHTFNVLEESGVTILDDTYNISPLSMKAAIDWASGRSETPKTLLTSGLLELGGHEEAFLKDLGAKAAFFDRIVFTTDSGRHTFAAAAGKEVELLNDATPKTDGGLLVCVGRMPASTIRRLLP